jgi:hypothetical protein
MIAAERRHHAAEHELAQARAVLERADMLGDGPERRPVRAPVEGRVLRVLQESEAVVASSLTSSRAVVSTASSAVTSSVPFLCRFGGCSLSRQDFM